MMSSISLELKGCFVKLPRITGSRPFMGRSNGRVFGMTWHDVRSRRMGQILFYRDVNYQLMVRKLLIPRIIQR